MSCGEGAGGGGSLLTPVKNRSLTSDEHVRVPKVVKAGEHEKASGLARAAFTLKEQPARAQRGSTLLEVRAQ